MKFDHFKKCHISSWLIELFIDTSNKKRIQFTYVPPIFIIVVCSKKQVECKIEQNQCKMYVDSKANKLDQKALKTFGGEVGIVLSLMLQYIQNVILPHYHITSFCLVLWPLMPRYIIYSQLLHVNTYIQYYIMLHIHQV